MEIFKRSWQEYCKVFGPIMEPAYKNDIKSRMKLVEALNFISKRQLNDAVNALQEIREEGRCDADTAAWSFFIGFCFELAGRKEQMMHCYSASASFGHRFYKPYLKMAIVEHSDADFEAAAQHYEEAVICIGELPEEQRDNNSLELAYSSLISCLTMMHRYREAETLLKQAGVGSASFAAAGAVLYAALGNRQKANVQLARLEIQDEERAEHTRALVEQILSGEHAHFHPVPIEEEKIVEFWDWFASMEEDLKLTDDESAAYEIADKLKDSFSFLERDARLRLCGSEKGRQVILKDFYAIGLQQGYGRLLAACPEKLKEYWLFSIEH